MIDKKEKNQKPIKVDFFKDGFHLNIFHYQGLFVDFLNNFISNY